MTGDARPIRREPPRFRQLEVVRTTPLSDFMVRVTLGGDELQGLRIDEPAASVRLLIPFPDAELVIPEWNGNEFLMPDGERPIIRTFTPRRFDTASLELDLEVVLHPGGAVSEWAAMVQPGAAAALSGPGRGYSIDPAVKHYVLAGDETALPAISQLIETIPAEAAIRVIVEIRQPAAEVDLPSHPRLDQTWVQLEEGAPPGSALVDAVRSIEIPDGAQVWAAGEAGAMFQVRKHLFEAVELPRRQATVRGYWKRR